MKLKAEPVKGRYETLLFTESPGTTLVATVHGPNHSEHSAFIVRACNCHEELLAALKEICEHSRLMLARVGSTGHRFSESGGKWIADPWTQAFEQARAAIAKAERGAS